MRARSGHEPINSVAADEEALIDFGFPDFGFRNLNGAFLRRLLRLKAPVRAKTDVQALQEP
ncbi:MAG: hypothetical protein DME18_00010 [Verrucomicrobia bacterium]|nr:MAG: hypothetical protein DME18_00010 [Verrucomicrobiota bacterium]